MGELLYSKKHIWIQEDGENVKLGITDYAQDKLGSILFLTLPDEGEELKIGDRFGDIESVKTVSDLISPVEGVVVAANEDLIDEPDAINESPYEAWIIKIKMKKKSGDLMDKASYDAYKDTL